MPVSEKRFSGIMNLDDANDVLPSTHHNDAHNVVFRGNGNNQLAQNIYGTRLINNPYLHSGTNVCIGSYYDSLKNRVFYFVHNVDPVDTLHYDGIFMFDVNTNTVSRLLMSYVDSAVPLFYFSRYYPVASVNMLYRPDDEGDILYWTDGLNRPMKLNIKEVTVPGKTHGAYWLNQYLTVSQYTPSDSPVCKYADDPSININNLKNRVFQFAYRWIYNDNTKSTFSPWSRMFTPVDVDTLSIQTDPTKNNVIQVEYTSGAQNVKAIEIIARQSLDTTYGDAFTVLTIDKDSNAIPSNSTQIFNFYNSEAYQFIDPQETVLLYSLIPIKANAQELLNGNQLIYGGITEGLNFDTILSVTSSTDLIVNISESNFTYFTDENYTFDYDPEYNYNSGGYYIIFQGVPNVGESYSFDITMRRDTGSGVEYATSTITIGPLGIGDDTFPNMEPLLDTALTSDSNMMLYNLASSVTVLTGVDPVYPGKYGVVIGGSSFDKSWITDVSNFVYNYISPSVPVDPTGVNTSAYKHNSRFGFGLVYFNEYGETNGVNTVNQMNIITPEIVSADLGGTQLTIPAISFDISNAPPSWAKYYSFVRTNNLTVSELYTIYTDNAYQDGEYGYLDITGFQTNTGGYIKYDFAKGDRVRLVGLKNGNASVYDYPILDMLLEYSTNQGFFLKVPYDATTMSTFTTGQNWYLEVYTPALNTTASGTQVYYEFGETYAIGTDVNGNAVHEGQIQNQIIGTGAQPATFTFYRGDVYSRLRPQLSNITPDWILDKSLSDLFPSKVEGLGRPFVIDTSAKETYYPTLVRYSLTYNPGTVVNETNIFYAQNYDEYDRARGDIRRLKVRGGNMRVYQSRGVGNVGVLENMIYNADGSDNLIQTSKIINQIHYYQGNYGMGWMNTSLASSAGADYFVDPVRGYQVRVAQDGITPISELYKAQYYVTDLATKYVKPVAGELGGYAKILGAYDFFEEQYIAVFQPTATLSNVTLAFNEARNCYTSFYDYSPEAINSIEGRIVSFRSGNIYVHDDTVNYNRFYGTQYGSSITFVFNDNNMVKKDFNAITQDCDNVWTSPTVGDINTAIGQESNLVSGDYTEYEGLYNAAFMRDANSLGGVIEGDYLKGTWLETKLSNTSTNLVYLSGLFINYTPSQRNG